MLGDYSTSRYTNDKDLKEFLEEQKTAGNIENIEDSEDNEEGTIAIIVDDYRIVIDEETLEIIEMGKTIPRPKISNIKMTYIDTNGTEKEVAEKSVLEGTPIKITFDVTFEEGTIVGVNKGTIENGKVEYTTDGTELEIIFIVSGKVEGEDTQKRQKVNLENLYKEAFIADVVKVGDFVNYSVGNWTQEDIGKVGSYYQGAALPTTEEKFGGFAVGQSKDACINPTTNTSYTNAYSGGWRILSKNADNTIKIIHAGTPEAYNFPRSVHNDSGLRGSINILGSYRNWSMYEDCSTDAVNTNYAVQGSAHDVTTAEIMAINQNSTLRKIGVQYNYYYVVKPGSPYYMLRSIYFDGRDYETSLGSTGIRPVVTLKAKVKVTAAPGQTTHDTPETAWVLSLED